MFIIAVFSLLLPEQSVRWSLDRSKYWGTLAACGSVSGRCPPHATNIPQYGLWFKELHEMGSTECASILQTNLSHYQYTSSAEAGVSSWWCMRSVSAHCPLANWPTTANVPLHNISLDNIPMGNILWSISTWTVSTWTIYLWIISTWTMSPGQLPLRHFHCWSFVKYAVIAGISSIRPT